MLRTSKFVLMAHAQNDILIFPIKVTTKRDARNDDFFKRFCITPPLLYYNYELLLFAEAILQLVEVAFDSFKEKHE